MARRVPAAFECVLGFAPKFHSIHRIPPAPSHHLSITTAAHLQHVYDRENENIEMDETAKREFVKIESGVSAPRCRNADATPGKE